MASQSVPSNLSSADARAVLAAAAERRRRAPQPNTLVKEELRLQEKRIKFQRLIDPGIVSPNSEDQALESLKKLQKLASNLLNKPENPDYKVFRGSNKVVKKHLIEPKGVLEYAIEMGFREKPTFYEASYVWNEKYDEDLRIGAEILDKHIALYEQKKELAKLEPVRERVLKEEVHRKVKLGFIEDRIAQRQRSALQGQARFTSPPPEGSRSVAAPSSYSITFQGEGRTLSTN